MQADAKESDELSLGEFYNIATFAGDADNVIDKSPNPLEIFAPKFMHRETATEFLPQIRRFLVTLRANSRPEFFPLFGSALHPIALADEAQEATELDSKFVREHLRKMTSGETYASLLPDSQRDSILDAAEAREFGLQRALIQYNAKMLEFSRLAHAVIQSGIPLPPKDALLLIRDLKALRLAVCFLGELGRMAPVSGVVAGSTVAADNLETTLGEQGELSAGSANASMTISGAAARARALETFTSVRRVAKFMAGGELVVTDSNGGESGLKPTSTAHSGRQAPLKASVDYLEHLLKRFLARREAVKRVEQCADSFLQTLSATDFRLRTAWPVRILRKSASFELAEKSKTDAAADWILLGGAATLGHVVENEETSRAAGSSASGSNDGLQHVSVAATRRKLAV